VLASWIEVVVLACDLPSGGKFGGTGVIVEQEWIVWEFWEYPFSTSSVNVIEETPVLLVLTLREARGYEDGEPLGTPLLSLSCQQK
jgi:hypothetical protein